MTSLIDVIFLLLLFFMLSSTFTRFAEVELAAAVEGGAASENRPVFLSLGVDALLLNGRDARLETLPQTLPALATGDDPLSVIVSLNGAVSAQRLTDLLAALRALPGLSVVVLGAA